MSDEDLRDLRKEKLELDRKYKGKHGKRKHRIDPYAGEARISMNEILEELEEIPAKDEPVLWDD